MFVAIFQAIILLVSSNNIFSTYTYVCTYNSMVLLVLRHESYSYFDSHVVPIGLLGPLFLLSVWLRFYPGSRSFQKAFVSFFPACFPYTCSIYDYDVSYASPCPPSAKNLGYLLINLVKQAWKKFVEAVIEKS